jgi:hypothetical protein
MALPLSREALQRQVQVELIPGTEVMDDGKLTLLNILARRTAPNCV